MAIEFGNGTSLGNVLCDMWRVHSNFSGNADPIASNWERADNTGTGQNYSNVVTESSGIFSFTTLGWYNVSWSHYFYAQDQHADCAEMDFRLSVDGGSNYTNLAHTQGYLIGSGYHYVTPTRTINFVVNNLSNYKFKFRVILNNTSIITTGSSSTQHTGFCITKIADV